MRNWKALQWQHLRVLQLCSSKDDDLHGTSTENFGIGTCVPRCACRLLTCSLHCLTARLCLQILEHSLGVIYNQFQLSLAQAISGTTGAKSSTVRRSTSAAMKAVPGCGRDSSGHARLSFSVSHANITVDAVNAGAKRKLQSTPCSATDGTRVSH